MENNNSFEIMVPEENNLERIDKFLPGALEIDLSRSYIQKLIKSGSVIVNDTTIKPNYKVKTDDLITVNIPEPEEIALEPQQIPLDIVYEDTSILVINKQPGLVVHPGPGNWDMTLVNGLLYHIKDLSSIGGVIRPGIVHRLDKDTSGLMVVAKNDQAHRSLMDDFANRRIKKKYCAIVCGKPQKDEDIIDRPIARHRKYRHKMTVDESGKEAVTEYKLKNMWNTRRGIFSMLDIRIHTGRTHQIRVHVSAMGNPVVGDPVYSKKWEKHRVPYLLLASTRLEFKHPENDDNVVFSVGLPPHMEQFIEKMEKIICSS